ncbi:hypothetical protein Ocin01_00009 [Orchesella cincta]|uniref:CDAN1-interacting nuclease 1 n=1 Tax=Orchesella cincta TaxID=48709 RepID=A0A1D2NNI4_ORCCI|nr:hypothetical protein Ocin01_00009 [Orchesella cincta]
MMSMNLYQDIIKTIKSTKLWQCQDVLEKKYPTISGLTLGSVLSNYIQKTMRMNHGKHNNPARIEALYQKYNRAVEAHEETGIILRISDDIRITPVLVAKFILEAYINENHAIKMKEALEEETDPEGGFESADSDSRKTLVLRENSRNLRPLTRNELKAEISKYLRDTASIPDRTLAYEVYMCTVHDDNYGPFPDAIKRTIGKEYEVRLSKLLQDQGILYLEEDQLRKQGYDKTPDIKLEVPIAINGKVITWIESKATFGDEETHQGYVKDQLTSYYNRFGPGLVIYWLGYVETILASQSKGIFVCDHLPASITKYDPTMS